MEELKQELLKNIDVIIKELQGESDIVIRYNKRDGKLKVCSQKNKKII